MFFCTGDTEYREFPDSFEILVLGAEDLSTGELERRGNHGDSYGLAIDQSASDVVFWAGCW